VKASETGKVEPTQPGGTGGSDNTLPDPTKTAKWCLVGLVILTVILAIVLNAAGATPKTVFQPSEEEVANFTLFAGFYFVAQAIAAAMAVIAPLLPLWQPPDSVQGDAARAAQTKADRGALLLGLAAVVGVVVSCTLGLFFLQAAGLHVSRTLDAIFTAAVVAAGAKPLHDFLGLVQNKNAPETGTKDGT
jgi:hypothetical protein